ncbi:hypothetical protein N8261_05930 [Flavobacteriaceae bacterium]|nr:hypothetical protein [Flavobacteriaceae bacterium]
MNDTCIRVQNCQTTTGYVVKKHYYDTLLENFRESAAHMQRNPGEYQYAIDIYWKRLQQQGDKWFMIIPMTAVQRKDYSDIERCVMDYSSMMQDYTKQ